jgi:hypothetical protein
MNVRVDATRYQGYGRCAAIAPEVLEDCPANAIALDEEMQRDRRRAGEPARGGGKPGLTAAAVMRRMSV